MNLTAQVDVGHTFKCVSNVLVKQVPHGGCAHLANVQLLGKSVI